MEQRRMRAVFMRGGTSKAVIFRQSDLPNDRKQWNQIFLSVMGSPDPNGRQLDGMGGGISSLSKVCVVGAPSRVDADVDYTFAQVSIANGSVDYSGNCGNMSSAIGPFAMDEGLVAGPADGKAIIRIHNTNTSKIIVSRFAMDGNFAAVDGDFVLDGVAGTGAPIRLDFVDPGGAGTGKLLPTGKAMDVLQIPGIGRCVATMVDAANPCIFVAAESVGLSGTEMPDQLAAMTDLLSRLEAIRCHASVAMGIAPNPAAAGAIPSVPKVATVAKPRPYHTLSGREIGNGDADILVRMISLGQPHRAVPLTGALCLAAACRVAGSVPSELLRSIDGDIRIGHPSGVVVVAAKAGQRDGATCIDHATVYRTARRLFEGEVFYRATDALGR
jgi:2-methylaconitate isomerase